MFVSQRITDLIYTRDKGITVRFLWQHQTTTVPATHYSAHKSKSQHVAGPQDNPTVEKSSPEIDLHVAVSLRTIMNSTADSNSVQLENGKVIGNSFGAENPRQTLKNVMQTLS